MASIRADLEGVVFVHDRTGLGEAKVLRAGDKVPRGVTVGDHLLEPTGRRTSTTPPSGDKPAGDTKPDEPPAGDDGKANDDAGHESTAADTVPADNGDEAPAGDGDEKSSGEPVERPPASGPGSDKGAWRRYAEHLGVQIDSEMSRADIQAAVEAHDNA